MAVIETTTRIDHKWLERKSKHELASIIMANLDRIEIFRDYGSEIAELRAGLRDVRAELHRAKQYLQNGSIEPALDVIGLALVRLAEASKEGK